MENGYSIQSYSLISYRLGTNRISGKYNMLKETRKFESPLINNGKKCDRCKADFPQRTLKCTFCGKSLIETKRKYGSH